MMKKKPTVRFTNSGVPYIDPKEILSSEAGQTAILAMAAMKPEHIDRAPDGKPGKAIDIESNVVVYIYGTVNIVGEVS